MLRSHGCEGCVSQIHNILFLCTGNSARSILAEAILNRVGAGRFCAFSAGSFPKGQVHPAALRLLEERGYAIEGLRSKSWDEFAAPGARAIHFVITVCDNAAGEICPIWPGRPVTAHWGIEDPAAAEGERHPDAFAKAYQQLKRRIGRLVALQLDELDDSTLIKRFREIGDTADAELADE